jgi:hypothetical protein
LLLVDVLEFRPTPEKSAQPFALAVRHGFHAAFAYIQAFPALGCGSQAVLDLRAGLAILANVTQPVLGKRKDMIQYPETFGRLRAIRLGHTWSFLAFYIFYPKGVVLSNLILNAFFIRGFY